MLYTFLALMTFNLLASFVYILGFNQVLRPLKFNAKKTPQKPTPR